MNGERGRRESGSRPQRYKLGCISLPSRKWEHPDQPGGTYRGVPQTRIRNLHRFTVEPIQLGDKIYAKVRAKYYFGSPVAGATATIKVTRTAFRDPYFPHTLLIGVTAQDYGGRATIGIGIQRGIIGGDACSRSPGGCLAIE